MIKKIMRKLFAPLNKKFLRIEEISSKLSESVTNTNDQLETLGKDIKKSIDILDDQQKNLFSLIRATRDNIVVKTRELWELRETKDYSRVFETNNPLVTVRIASYNRTEALIKKAIDSVLKQTYQNFEIIIVNDGPNLKTKKAIQEIKDKRIKYYELPYRNRYPQEDKKRWQVAGSPGMNYGAFMAKGSWIAPLDDDDEFTPDHIETLLKKAIQDKSELVLGSFEQKLVNIDKTNEVRVITPNLPPEEGGCTMQANLYMTKLNDIFSYDRYSYIYNEPGDWNLISQMLECGVRISVVSDVVTKMEHITDLSTRK